MEKYFKRQVRKKETSLITKYKYRPLKELNRRYYMNPSVALQYVLDMLLQMHLQHQLLLQLATANYCSSANFLNISLLI